MSEKVSLEEKILVDYKKALKEGRRNQTGCLRLLRAEIKNRQIQKQEKLSNEEIIQIIRNSVKKECESLDYFMKGHRDSLVKQTREEIAILKKYLPVELSSEEIEKIAQKIIIENQFNHIKELGPAMKLIMDEIKGRADGRIASQVVRRILEQ